VNEQFNDYQSLIVVELRKDRELAVIYLKNSLLEEDPRMLFMALRDVIQAYSTGAEEIFKDAIAQNAQLNDWIADESKAEFGIIKNMFPKLKLSLRIEQEGTDASVYA
jgi:DNA-binding phage protein